jgi:CheY-like chemotaxis protein
MNVATATALLVDDDDASFQATQRRLEDDGYTVLLARDASDGLARAKQSVPDVIFTHLTAGGHNNVDFIQALRSDDVCRHMLVMVVTSRPESGPTHKQLRPVSRDRW